MVTPRVTEIVRQRQPRDDDAPRTPRMTPYHRPSQRDMVRASLTMSGAFDDFHGDSKRRV